ncbi:MAG: hypothetical protein Kow0069_26200 [Promethearchaeota archaeon]
MIVRLEVKKNLPRAGKDKFAGPPQTPGNMEVDETIASAEALAEANEYERAEQKLTEALKQARVEGDLKAAKKLNKAYERVVRAWAADVNALGDQLFKQKTYKQAMAYYEKSIEIIKKIADQSRLNNYEREFQAAAAKYAEEVNRDGDQLLREKRFREAIDVYQQSVDLMELARNESKVRAFTKVLNKARAGLAEQLAGDAGQAVEAGRWDEAIEKYEEALEVARTTDDAKLVAKLEKDRLGVYEEWARRVNAEGDALFKAGKYAEAVPKYAESVEVARKSGNDKLVREFEGELSKAFAEQAEEINRAADEAMKAGKYEQAAEIYRKSVEMAQKAGDDKRVAKFQKELDAAFEALAKRVNEQGDAAFKAGEFDKAVELYARSVSLAKRAGKERLVGNFQGELNRAYREWSGRVASEAADAEKGGDWEGAASLLERARELAAASGDEKFKDKATAAVAELHDRWVQALVGRADDFSKRGNLQAALELYERAVELAEKAGVERRLKKVQKARDKCLRKMR